MTARRVQDRGSAGAALRLSGIVPIQHRDCQDDLHERFWDYADGQACFYSWLGAANAPSLRIAQLGPLNLPPRDPRADYNGRAAPDEAADVTIDEMMAVRGAAVP